MAKQWAPRRVTNEDDRKSGSSDYIQLDEGENFLGKALFDADPTKNDPGYYEYFEHWVTGGPKAKSMPCAGEGCPFCEDGDKPRVRAKTLWLVSRNEKGDELDPPELRIFNFNRYVIDQFTEIRGEGEKIKGREFRISRLDDRGNYSVMPKNAKITAAEVKEALSDTAAPDFDKMVTGQLRKGMEALGLASAMHDDDDEEDETPKKGKGKGSKASSAKGAKGSKAKDDDEEPEDEDETQEWPEEAEDLTVVVAKVGTKADPNTIEAGSDDYEGKIVLWGTSDIDVTELDKGDKITVSYATDDDDDKVLSEMEVVTDDDEEEEEDEKPAAKKKGKAKEEPDEEEGALPAAIEDAEFEVVSIDNENQTIDVKSDDLGLAFTLYFLDKGPASKVDFDDYSAGDIINIDAEKDAVDDMVATKVPEITAKAKSKKKKTGKGSK